MVVVEVGGSGRSSSSSSSSSSGVSGRNPVSASAVILMYLKYMGVSENRGP